MNRSSFATSVVSASLAAALTVTSAFALPSASERLTARELGQRGIVALEQKDYRAAEEAFSRADALVHAPTLLLGLARAQVGLGKLVQAHETYTRIVREGVAPSSPASWTQALELAKIEAAALAPKLSWLLVRVNATTEVHVEIDGHPLKQAAIGVQTAVNPGSHVVVASTKQGPSVKKTVKLAEGETRELELHVPSSDTLAEAELWRSRDEAGARGGSWQRPTGWTSIAVAGAGAIAGGVLGGLAIARHDALVDSCPGGSCPPDQQGALDDYRTLGTASTVAFVASGALAVFGTVLLTTAPPEQPRKSGVWLSPLGIGTTVEF